MYVYVVRVLSIALAPVPGVLPFVATCEGIALCLLLGCRSRLRQSSEIVNMSYCSSILPVSPIVFAFFFSYHPTWYMWVHVSYFFFQIYVCYVLYVILYK